MKRDSLHNTINRQNLSLRDRQVDAVFLDAAKAFYKVANSALFQKLSQRCVVKIITPNKSRGFSKKEMPVFLGVNSFFRCKNHNECLSQSKKLKTF